MWDFSGLNAKVHGGNSLCVRWEGRSTGSSVFNQSVAIFLDGLIKSGPQPSWEPLLVLVTTSARLHTNPGSGGPGHHFCHILLVQRLTMAQIHRTGNSLCLLLGCVASSICHLAPDFPDSSGKTLSQKEEHVSPAFGILNMPNSPTTLPTIAPEDLGVGMDIVFPASPLLLSPHPRPPPPSILRGHTET